MARLRTAFKTFWTTFSVWMARLGPHGKVFLVTFSYMFVALFIVHLFYLPTYWAYASSQQGKDPGLYFPSVWTPAVIFYSVLVAVMAVATFSLLSGLRKSKANEASIFITTFFLSGLGFHVLLALSALQRGHPMRLDYYTNLDPKGAYAMRLFTGLLSLVSAVSTTAVYECYKLVRWAGKRLKSNAEP